MPCTKDLRLRELEQIMQMIPNFAPQGYGVIILRGQDHQHLQTETMTQEEILRAALSNIRFSPFVHRLNQHLQRKEDFTMEYRNSKHKTVFTKIVKETNRQNYALMAALYLLSANHKLWITAKGKISFDCIYFDHIHLPAGTEQAYTLFCTAKDLYLGTKHVTIRDLADTTLISAEMFALICNAMAIRRFGLGAIHFNMEGT